MNSISCPSCGANVDFEIESKKVKCNYCSLEIELNTGLFDGKIIFTGNKQDQSKFLNIAHLMSNARKAENYTLAYDYCNELVALDPKNPKLWEIKAQIYFLKLSGNFDEKNLKSILTFYQGYLNSNKKQKSVTFQKLFNNLFNAYSIKYNNLSYDKSNSGKIWDSYSDESINLLISYINISEIQFSLTDNIEILKNAVKELSGHKKNYWLTTVDGKVVSFDWCKNFNFDPLKKRSDLVKLIKEKNKKYRQPQILYEIDYSSLSTSNGSCFIATCCYEDFNHDDVISLRKFRDNYLLNNFVGVFIIKFYYCVSPKIVPFLSSNRYFSITLRELVIKPIVKIMYNLNLI